MENKWQKCSVREITEEKVFYGNGKRSGLFPFCIDGG